MPKEPLQYTLLPHCFQTHACFHMVDYFTDFQEGLKWYKDLTDTEKVPVDTICQKYEAFNGPEKDVNYVKGLCFPLWAFYNLWKKQEDLGVYTFSELFFHWAEDVIKMTDLEAENEYDSTLETIRKADLLFFRKHKLSPETSEEEEEEKKDSNE